MERADRTWRDHRNLIIEGALGGPVVCLGFFAIVWFIGMMGEGYMHRSMEKARCEKQAVTPHEYHQCR